MTLRGLAVLMKMAFDGHDLTPLALELGTRALNDPTDAVAWMDLSTLWHLQFQPEKALKAQTRALELQQVYHLPAKEPARIRLLALMGPGDLAANTPLEFLVADSDVALTMLYVVPNEAFPVDLPEHDLVFVAVNESEQNQPLLAQLARVVSDWKSPVLNAPDRIAMTSRDGTHAQLDGAPGLVMPPSVRVDRTTLDALGRMERSIDTLLAGGRFPVIVRPIDSHAGHGLAKLEAPDDLIGYLETVSDTVFSLSPFVDYRSPDGQFRKYRVALVGKRAYAVHMAISDHWMIHYLNAGMTESAEKRAEEARFLAEFDERFLKIHQAALEAISARMQLDYLVIDCGETPDGRLLVFEVDTGAVIHAMDPLDRFAYKAPQMRRVFAAFRELLDRAIEQRA